MTPFELTFAVENAFKQYSKQNFNFPGYEVKYTWCSDLMIALPFGKQAIQDTIKTCKDNWKSNKESITEMAAALNFICWYLYENKDELWQIFSDEYHNFIDWVYDNCNDDITTFMARFLD